MPGTTDGGGGGGGAAVPQPLIVRGGVSAFSSRAAVRLELAMRIYANTNISASGKSPWQVAQDAIQQADIFMAVGGGLIDDMLDGNKDPEDDD